MNLKLFYSPPKWFAFDAPEKRYVGGRTYESMTDPGVYLAMKWDYEKAYAEAKANALEVGNVEIAVFRPTGLNQDTKSYYFHSKLNLPYFEVKEGEDYDWPGSAVIKDGKYILIV